MNSIGRNCKTTSMFIKFYDNSGTALPCHRGHKENFTAKSSTQNSNSRYPEKRETYRPEVYAHIQHH